MLEGPAQQGAPSPASPEERIASAIERGLRAREAGGDSLWRDESTDATGSGVKGTQQMLKLVGEFDESPESFYLHFVERARLAHLGASDAASPFRVEDYMRNHAGVSGDGEEAKILQSFTDLLCEVLRALENGNDSRAAALVCSGLVAIEAKGLSKKWGFAREFIPLVAPGSAAFKPADVAADKAPIPRTVAQRWASAIALRFGENQKLQTHIKKIGAPPSKGGA
jgi:hypothetical protein